MIVNEPRYADVSAGYVARQSAYPAHVVSAGRPRNVDQANRATFAGKACLCLVLLLASCGDSTPTSDGPADITPYSFPPFPVNFSLPPGTPVSCEDGAVFIAITKHCAGYTWLVCSASDVYDTYFCNIKCPDTPAQECAGAFADAVTSYESSAPDPGRYASISSSSSSAESTEASSSKRHDNSFRRRRPSRRLPPPMLTWER